MLSLETNQYLDSFINHEHHLHKINPSCFHLKRIQQLLELLGNPQNSLKIIHVAGSKGKGSVCAMTANVLREAGYRVGLYTSPHLNNYRERIRVPGRVTLSSEGLRDMFYDQISEKEVQAILAEMKPSIEKVQEDHDLGDLTFFEMLTALALVYFKKQNVDFVILETGLGGRLDATNVVSPIICAITSISLEHTQLLGGTLEKIAREKAAIIKKGCRKVILAPHNEEVSKVFLQKCQEEEVSAVCVGKDIRWEMIEEDFNHQIFNIVSKKDKYRRMYAKLRGDCQLENAAIVIGIIESLKDGFARISRGALHQGIKRVFWPGRCEIIKKHPVTIVDGAHNEDSARGLVKAVQAMFPEDKVVVVLGISEDKEKEKICAVFNDFAAQVIVTKADHPRAYAFQDEELEKLFPLTPCRRTETVEEALILAETGISEDNIIVVAGSMFVMSEARKLCIKSRK